jgi:hypothetical protein
MDQRVSSKLLRAAALLHATAKLCEDRRSPAIEEVKSSAICWKLKTQTTACPAGRSRKQEPHTGHIPLSGSSRRAAIGSLVSSHLRQTSSSPADLISAQIAWMKSASSMILAIRDRLHSKLGSRFVIWAVL